MPKKNLKGIGGWLIFPTIGLFLGIILGSVLFVLFGLVIFVTGEIGILNLSYLIYSLFIVGGSIYLLTLEFKKRKTFPSRMILFSWISVGFTILISIIEWDDSGLGVQIFSTIIWTMYFLSSERVKNTFVK